MCNSMVKKPQKAFIAKEEQVRNLENILDTYFDVLKEHEIRDHVIQSFKFEKKVTLIELYNKKNLRRTKFIEKLEEFFFVGETYFYPEPKDTKLFGVIILSRFKNLLDVGMHLAIKYKGQFDKVPDLSWVLFGTPFKRVNDSSSQEKIKELKTILAGYRHLIIDGYFMRDVLKAFTSKKPVTSIEVSNLEPKVVNQLQKDLKKFFYVDQGYSNPDLLEYNFFVSRYKNLPNIISFYSKNNSGVYDRFPDLAGAFLLDLVKYPLQKIAFYCFDDRLKELNIIK